jgi:hypothetical protein
MRGFYISLQRFAQFPFVNLRVLRGFVVRRKITDGNLWLLSSVAYSRSFDSGFLTMNQEDNQAREHEVRERIARQMRSIGQAPRKPLPDEELQRLKTAASRLDQMLKASDDADHEALRSAAGRLDNLLRDLRDGKDVPSRLKRPTKTNNSPTNHE